MLNLNGLHTKLTLLKWVNTVVLMIKKWKPKVSLGFMETRFNMVEEIMKILQVSFSDGKLLHTIWMLKKEKLTNCLSKTKTVRKDVSKYSSKVPKEKNKKHSTTTSMK